MPPETLGAILQRLRQSRGISAAKLAERVGCGLRTIQRLESDAPGSSSVATVAAILDELDASETDRLAVLEAAGR